MSELAVGSLSGLAANSYVIDVASGSQLTQPGMVLQVVSTTKTDTFSSSIASGGSAAITGLTASITPSSTSSKILVIAHTGGDRGNGSFAVKLTADGSDIAVGDAAGSRSQTTANGVGNTTQFQHLPLQTLHSPATTSSVTYGVSVVNLSGATQTNYVNRGSADADAVDSPRSASTITVMEIAG